MNAAKINTKNKNLAIGVIILGLVILVGIGYSIFTSTTNEPQVIKIGHISPMTGDAAVYGEWETQGIDLAVEEINAKGGIKGKKLLVIHEDDQLNPTMMVNALNKLITVDKVQAVIGETSSSGTLALSSIAEKNKVVLISDGAAAIKVTEAGDYVFRVYPTNAIEGKKLVEIASSLNLTDAAILYINDDFGTDLSKVIYDEYTKTGGNVLISEGYAFNTIDFRTQLTKIKAKNPKAIFLLGYPKDMAIVMKQSKEIGIKSQFLAPDSFNVPQIIEWSGNTTEGVIFVYPADGDPMRWQDFRQKINTTYGKEANTITAMAYDATYVLATAMESGVTGEEIKTGLYQIKDFPGVTGNITFDKKGDAINRLMRVMIVKEGKFQDYP